jgi:hypothetical protein
MVAQHKGPDGRDVEEELETEEEDDEVEEEVDRLYMTYEGGVRQSVEGDTENLVVVTPGLDDTNENMALNSAVLERIGDKENGREDSYYVSTSKTKSTGGENITKGGTSKVLGSKGGEPACCLGQKEGINNNLRAQEEPSVSIESINGEGRKHLEGVYSAGPRIVYNKLTNAEPLNKTISCPTIPATVSAITHNKRTHPLPANIRRQNHIIHNLKLRVPTSAFSQSADRSTSLGSDANSCGPVLQLAEVTRNNPSRSRPRMNAASSLSSAGAVLCCSSLSSSDIKNCNNRFITKHDEEAAIQVWHDVAELGVEGEEQEERYIERILCNEKREEAARRLREQTKHGSI